MAEQKESSVLFSLRELMSLEESRIREEEAEKDRRARAEVDARLAAERAAREAEERRLKEEEETRRAEAQRRKEEETRLEAIRHGEIEKARAEAEHRSRMEALARQQAHEQQLVALRTDQSKKRLKWVVGVVSAALVAAAVGGVIFYQESERKAEAQRLESAQKIQAAEQQVQALRSQFDTAEKRQQELIAQVTQAKDDATKNRLQAELEQARRDVALAGQALSKAKGAGSSSGRASADKNKAKPATKPCTCEPGDPLCSCM